MEPAKTATETVIAEVARVSGERIAEVAAAHMIWTFLGRASAPPSSPRRRNAFLTTCVRNAHDEGELSALLPANRRPDRATIVAGGLGGCGSCHPASGYELDEHGYPDATRPCPTCRPAPRRAA